jgi:arginine N-succinyltransferase
MFLIRQSSRDDAAQILEVARYLDSVNLPAQPERIDALLALSDASFAGDVDPSEREFVFVLVDGEADRIIGTSMIHAQHGTKRSPHIYFQVLADERYSETLDRFFVHQGLRLGYDYHGPTEIGGLILLPEYRRNPAKLGKLLSYTRFLFIAMHRELFRDRVLSELLPPLEPDGKSILWEHLGRRFTGLSYQEADRMSKDNKEFIRALFPHNVIYMSLLPQQVQNVIGKAGPDTRGVEKILRRIGFRYAKQIDPFDGGPHFMAKTDDITLVRDARQVTVTAVPSADLSRPWALIAVERTDPPRFHAAGGRVIPSPDGASMGITQETRETLGIEHGDTVWAVIP